MPKFAVAATSRHLNSGSGDSISVRPSSRLLSSPAGVFALLVALLSSVLVAFGPAAPAAAAPADDIHALVNDARAAEGRAPLARNGELDAVALAWAKQMAGMGGLQHNPNVSGQIPSGWTSWGENIAQGQRSGAAMHQAWMNSPGHYANIMGDFSDIGVAFIEAGGTTWGVQVFATYSGGAGRAPAPPKAETAPAPAPEPQPTADEQAAAEKAPAEQATAEKKAAEKKAAEKKAEKKKQKQKAAAEKKKQKQKAAAAKKKAEKEAAVAAGTVPTATAVAAPERDQQPEAPLSASVTRALSPATNPAVLAGMGAFLLLALILLSPTLRRILFPRRRQPKHR
jgi:uncharacterized protein YkwD